MIKLDATANLKLDDNSTATVDIRIEEGSVVDASNALKGIFEELRKGLPAEQDPQDKLDRIAVVLNKHEEAHLGLDGTLLNIREIINGE